MFGVNMTWNLNCNSSFEQYLFFVSFRKEFVPNIMRHPRYCLIHHPGSSSNITHTSTHFSTPPMPPTLAHRPLYPRWCTTHTTHATHTGTSPQHVAHVTHASQSPTLARHPRQHATSANTPPISTPFLKLLGI